MARPVLLVEADRRVGEAMTRQLVADGYRVELARTAGHARILAGGSHPQLAVLGSFEAPRGPLALLEEIRTSELDDPWDPSMPTLVIGHASGELDALRAFESGADDFLPAPIGYLELRARLAALLRRSLASNPRPGVVEVGPLRVDPVSRVATFDGEPLDLRRMEFDLLLHLAGEPDRVFTRAELLGSIWGYRSAGSTRTVDTHASRLRVKLRRAGRRWPVTVWGVGYRLR